VRLATRLTLAAAALAALLAAGCAAAPRPPAAPPPKSQRFSGTALLVVDVQRIQFPICRQDAVLSAITRLVAKAEAARLPVIYVYHSLGEGCTPGEESWLLHPAIRPPEGHEQVRKTAGDSFVETELEALLDARKTGRLVVCGLSSTACVNAALWGAKSRGYRLVLAADAHSASLREDDGIIDRVNANWRQWGASVLPVDQIEFD